MGKIATLATTGYLILYNMIYPISWYTSLKFFQFIYWIMGKKFPRGYTDKAATGWGLGMKWGAFPLSRVKMDFEEDPKIKDYDGPYIVVMNHQATFDIGLAFYIMSRLNRRRLRWVLKKELLSVPFVGQACLETRCAFVDRKDRAQSEAAIKEFAKSLKQDKVSACIFVEGTRATKKKLEKSDFTNLLNPRPLGLSILHNNLRNWPILSVTIDWQKANGHTMLDTSIWRSTVKISTKVYEPDEVGEDISKWLLEEEWPRFDALLSSWHDSEVESDALAAKEKKRQKTKSWESSIKSSSLENSDL